MAANNTNPKENKKSMVKDKIKFNHQEIDAKWQERWEKAELYKTPGNPGDKKKYILDMYPYPSGATLHVGHLEGYIGTDIMSRFYRMRGFSVLHPMGWDSFGLPAENYAIKTGIPPYESTPKNIENFKRQLSSSGLSYDWAQEIDSSDPEIYKWNQWFFIQLFKKGLAYKKKAPVNWCPKDETVLANEQVINGKCERCDTEVVQKELDQWFFKITVYADKLIEGLDKVDWLPEVKTQQINWIGKKEGINIVYKVKDTSESITCFTTRPDTNFGATFIVLAPEHAFVQKIIDGHLEVSEEVKQNVSKYVEESLSKSKSDRQIEGRKKTGAFTGFYAINNLNGEEIPIWISDFVLTDFGTGAVVGVPGHDIRDFEFAQTFNIPIKRVVVGSDNDTSEITSREQVQEEEGRMINSGFLDGKDIHEATKLVMDYLEEKGYGTRVQHYHLRDWLISRQRYWGTPIPMIYCEEHEWQPVPDTDLPVLLPKDVDFKPTGESPITRSKTFQEGVVCPVCGKPAKREVDTMDGFVDSSWYYIRFVDPHNTKTFADPEKMKQWLPVDIYVGGGHVVQHLLFARFFWKVMYDEGLIDKSLGDEPFLKLRAPGWILGPDSRKMSKRWGNVITPDDIIPKFGADVLRLYEMFMGPFDIVKPWSLTGVEGMRRFIERVWQIFTNSQDVSLNEDQAKALEVMRNKTIKRVTSEVEDFRYNTAIAALMEYVNFIREVGQKIVEHKNSSGTSEPKTFQASSIEDQKAWTEALKTLAQLIAPFAPHLAEEVWVEKLGQQFSVHTSRWPTFDESLLEEEYVTIVVQVNGKLRANITVQKDESVQKEKVIALAKENEAVKRWTEGMTIKNEVFVPGRLVNFVVA